ncbi:hypothetical protein BDN71DRAFT_232096 [Pleurotus eryngii]|uniref:Uncharacterized protein n=1 Tax=Pleurotus eryngii TaxID=5323 RepID=A0A9P6DIP8_PLEER|nr:hypothetical protein BDN71DRAFT_232096 [Pleurotus eryngii]
MPGGYPATPFTRKPPVRTVPGAPVSIIKRSPTPPSPPSIDLQKPVPTRKQDIFNFLWRLCSPKITNLTIELCAAPLSEISDKYALLLQASVLAASHLVLPENGAVPDQVESLVRVLEANLSTADITR